VEPASPGVPSAGPPSAAGAADASNPHTSGNQEQEFAAVEQLAERLKGTPEDAEGWAMLARSYGMLGRIDDALRPTRRPWRCVRRRAAAGRLRRHAGAEEQPHIEGDP